MTHAAEGYQRWYDKDPALKRALEHLRNAPDKYQAQISLNIIKIIIEHKIESAGGHPVEDISRLVEDAAISNIDHGLRRRWYDVNETLHSAMQLLRDCPDDLQKSVIPTIATMIENTLSEVF